MAELSELRSLFNDSELQNRTSAAVIIAATNELQADPGTANGRIWALKVLTSPESWGKIFFKSILAVNSSVSAENIRNVGDGAIQTNVDALVADIVAADSGV